jgi:uncharacterized Zn finger protein
MSFWGFRPYVPVAARRAKAAREIEGLRKKGRAVAPIVIEGRKIAKSFWGKAWCDNLERYSDFANRLPRGRTYVGNGSVIDLQIERGKVEALVSGSEIYKVKIDIAVAAPSRWKAICADCAGSVASLVELLKGKLSKNVMERVCREADGLFPAPREIEMSCSCPDWAGMCKHVAATLYGVGARLDSAPELLFALRGVNREDMVCDVSAGLPLTRTAAASRRVLVDDDVAALFGLDMTEPAAPLAAPVTPRAQTACGDKRGATYAKPAGEDVESAARAKRKTKRMATAPPSQRKASLGSALVAPPAARKSAKAKAISDKPLPNARPARESQPIAVVEAGDARASSKRRGVAVGPLGRTRAAKWIGVRARKKGV